MASTPEVDTQFESGKPSGPDSAAPATRRPPTAGLALLRLVAQASPGLWAKVVAEKVSATQQRERYLDLVEWLLKKHGAEVERPGRQNYFEDKRVIEGRLDLRAVRGDAILALEFATRATKPCAYKLLAARKNQEAALLVAHFGTSRNAVFDAFSRVTAKPTQAWFDVVHLLS